MNEIEKPQSKATDPTVAADGSDSAVSEIGGGRDESGDAGFLNPVTDETAPLSLSAVRSTTGEPIVLMAQRSHVGNVRPRNEDSCFVFYSAMSGQEPLVPFGLCVVADGMGGHRDGHEASRRATLIVSREVMERLFVPLLADRGAPPEPIRDIMLRAVQTANRSIYNAGPDSDSGTTVTAGVIFGRRLYLAHVGDSRAYLFSKGRMKVLTADHSYVQRLMDAGQLTPEEAAVHPQRNFLYRSVGQGDELEIDTYTQSLPSKGQFLVCSDGLWGFVPDSLIRDVLQSDRSVQEMADALVELALDAGGSDNITVVLVDFTF